MKVFITIPGLSVPHGGLRVIIEWANRLSKWHEVYLYSLKRETCGWMNISPEVIQVRTPSMKGMDCLIITSPHSIDFEDRPDCPDKVFIFCQMAEHLFRPDDKQWERLCMKFYTSKHPMFSISKWNMDLFKEMGRTGETHYIGNGVNLGDFTISEKEKDGKTILIEGWESLNPSKDPRKIGPKVAKALKEEGYKIIAYSQAPLKTMPDVPDEYHQRPTLEKLNELYERATILIKASRYDARSCSPVEAMTKGTVTVRAIDKGDDDLISGYNSIRTGYRYDDLLWSAKTLLEDRQLRERLSKNCIDHVKKYTWNYWMDKINAEICR